MWVLCPINRLLRPPVFPVLYFPTGYCLILNPRKSNPGSSVLPLDSIGLSVWPIRVFSGLISNPTGFNHSVIAVLHCSMIPRSLEITTKSSAYLIRFIWVVVPLLGYISLTSLSIPNSAMLASIGLITPPWGVPASVSSNTPLSSTPALSHCFRSLFRRLGQWILDSR